MPGDVEACRGGGGDVTGRRVPGEVRARRDRCQLRVFIGPEVAAVVLVSDQDRLVLVKRAIEPALGRWSFPSGYVDRGEVVEEAAIREVLEETGLYVNLDGLIGVYSQDGNPVILAVYAATVVGGCLRTSEESTEVSWHRVDELPPLPFPHDVQILADWKARLSNDT